MFYIYYFPNENKYSVGPVDWSEHGGTHIIVKGPYKDKEEAIRIKFYLEKHKKTS